MKKEMLINVMQPEECRIAIIEDGVLQELYVERANQESYVNNIYKGKIVNIEPSIQAAFVDFGIGRNGFLHQSDVAAAYFRDKGGDGGERREERREERRDDRRGDRDRGGRRFEPVPIPSGRAQADVMPPEFAEDEFGGELAAEVVEEVGSEPVPVAEVTPEPQPQREAIAPRVVAVPEELEPEFVEEETTDDFGEFGGDLVMESTATAGAILHAYGTPPTDDEAAAVEDEVAAEMQPPADDDEPETEEKPKRKKAPAKKKPTTTKKSASKSDKNEKPKRKRVTKKKKDDDDKPEVVDSAEHRTTGDEPEFFFDPMGPNDRFNDVTPAKEEKRKDDKRHEKKEEPAEEQVTDDFGGDDFGSDFSSDEGQETYVDQTGDEGTDEVVIEGEGDADAAYTESGPSIDNNFADEDDLELGPPRHHKDRNDRGGRGDRDRGGRGGDRGGRGDRDRGGRGDRDRGGRGGDRGGDRGGRGERSGGRGGDRGGRDGGMRPPPIETIFKRGQEVIVQVIKESIGTKAPTLSTHISIAGRYLVLAPWLSRIAVSRKITDEATRQRLKEIMRELNAPAGLGFIIRTAAIDRNAQELQSDLSYLVRLWEVFTSRVVKRPAPIEVYRESDMITRTIRDMFTSDIDAIYIDDPEAFAQAQEFMKFVMPRYADRVKLHADTEPIFHRYKIEEEIRKLQDKKVPLPTGGSLVIEQTEALVAIDVNSGTYRSNDDAEETAYQTNLHAAKEIARQLRLRNLGGVIINDFIDMKEERHRRNVEETLRKALRRDRSRTKILKTSAFGVIEMTRQRVQTSLKRTAYHDCPHCRATGHVKTPLSMSIDVIRMIQLAAHRKAAKTIEIHVSTDVANYLLNKKRRDLMKWEDVGEFQVAIVGHTGVSPEFLELRGLDNNGNEVSLGQVSPIAARLPERRDRDDDRSDDRGARGDRGDDRGDRGRDSRGDRGHGGHGGQGGHGGHRDNRGGGGGRGRGDNRGGGGRGRGDNRGGGGGRGRGDNRGGGGRR